MAMGIVNVGGGGASSANAITFEDGQSLQEKFNNGSLRGQTGATGATGPKGEKGDPGSDATIPYLVGSGTATADTANSATALGPHANAAERMATALGPYANATGQVATALGPQANANAYAATALGPAANATGEGSIAVGRAAGAHSDESMALGELASVSSDSSFSTALGYHASVGGNNSAVLGANAVTYGDNTIQLGNASSLSTLSCKVPITSPSDERDKTDIREIEDGATDFLKKVKAVTFVYNQRELYRPKEPELDENGKPIIEDGVDYLTEEDHENLRKYGYCRYDKEAHAKGTLKGTRRRAGLIAQETQAALKAIYGTADYANIVNDNLHDLKATPEGVPEGIESALAMNYEALIPFLIKAFQELDARVTAQETTIADLVARLTALEAANHV